MIHSKNVDWKVGLVGWKGLSDLPEACSTDCKSLIELKDHGLWNSSLYIQEAFLKSSELSPDFLLLLK